MKYFVSIVLITFSLTLSQNSWAWGKTGHRVVAEVASKYLTKKSKAKIQEILKGHSMAEVSNFLDDVKSDHQEKYDTLRSYHYVTIPDGMKYSETNISPKGDAIKGLNFVIKQLKTHQLSPEKEVFYLKILIHLVGDIHQPLHVGNGEDLGGNKVYATWFGKKSNLHKIWDSEMINGKLYSFTELTKVVNNTTDKEVKKWQSNSIEEWAQECVALRPGIYKFDSSQKYWEYEYTYNHWNELKQQLLKGGVRLAGILNEIYG